MTIRHCSPSSLAFGSVNSSLYVRCSFLSSPGTSWTSCVNLPTYVRLFPSPSVAKSSYSCVAGENVKRPSVTYEPFSDLIRSAGFLGSDFRSQAQLSAAWIPLRELPSQLPIRICSGFRATRADSIRSPESTGALPADPVELISTGLNDFRFGLSSAGSADLPDFSVPFVAVEAV